MSETYQELIDRAKAGYPESWIPKKKDEILAGTFTRLEMGNSAFGPAPIAVITDESGKEWSCWLFHTAVLNQFKQAAPQPGDKVVVLYGGEVPVKDPKPGRSKTYHSYRVVKEGSSDTSIAWLSLDGGSDTPVTEEVNPDDIPY